MLSVPVIRNQIPSRLLHCVCQRITGLIPVFVWSASVVLGTKKLPSYTNTNHGKNRNFNRRSVQFLISLTTCIAWILHFTRDVSTVQFWLCRVRLQRDCGVSTHIRRTSVATFPKFLHCFYVFLSPLLTLLLLSHGFIGLPKYNIFRQHFNGITLVQAQIVGYRTLTIPIDVHSVNSLGTWNHLRQ